MPVDFEKSKVLLGDFGIAKILAKNNVSLTSWVLRGSVGHTVKGNTYLGWG